jgi:hypothetical protein
MTGERTKNQLHPMKPVSLRVMKVMVRREVKLNIVSLPEQGVSSSNTYNIV